MSLGPEQLPRHKTHPEKESSTSKASVLAAYASSGDNGQGGPSARNASTFWTLPASADGLMQGYLIE